jgi:drug/metabolite transporter (DMT)-like permease
MKLTSKLHYYIVLHITIILWGFTSILGKLLSMTSTAIVIDRMVIAYLALASMLFFRKKELVKRKYLWQMYAVGVITAAHWATFFEALKVSNISVTLCCLASCSFFVSLIQPFFLKTKLKLYEVVLGLFVILGIYIIFTFESDYSLGIILSLISSFLAAIFSVWNAEFIKYNSAFSITLNEMLAGSVAMILYFIFTGDFSLQEIIPVGIDWFYIMILGVFCTAIAFLLGTEVLKKLSPFTVSISINLEPVYAILLALYIFGESEVMSLEFYIGASIILATIVANAFLKSKESSV